MASGIYNRFKANLMKKVVDLVGDTINVALFNNSKAFVAGDTVYSDTNELPTAGGYTQGGAALAGKSVTEGATTKWDANDRAWTGATFTAYFAQLYDASASDNVIALIDFGGAQAVVSGTFTIQWNANGIITLAS